MREKEPATNIIFVRHGKTDFPLDRIYCDDKEDPPLNADGRAQANATADLLNAIPIDAVYCSTTARTRQTAAIIAEVKGLSVHERSQLQERRFGIWEGLYFHEIESQYADEYLQWKKNPARFQPQGGESMLDLQRRLDEVLAQIIGQHPGHTVVVVSHVGPIRVCISNALQMPIEMHRQLRIDYASISRIDYGSTKINLMYLNYQKQLPA